MISRTANPYEPVDGSYPPDSNDSIEYLNLEEWQTLGQTMAAGSLDKHCFDNQLGFRDDEGKCWVLQSEGGNFYSWVPAP